MQATAPTSTGEPAAALQPAYQRKPALPALTGIRTLLAVSILMFHFTPSGLGWFYPIIDNGYVFVSFFFLISGYILAYNYLDRPARLKLSDFWVARLSRLYPVYLFALIIFWEMLRVEHQVRSTKDFWEGTFLSIILMQGWFPTLATFWNTVAWTLSCEMTLYAIFPLLMRVRWPSKPLRLIVLILIFWSCGLVPQMIYLTLNPDHLSTVITHTIAAPWAHAIGLADVHLNLVNTDRYTGGWWVEWLKYTPLPYLCTFMAGIVLGKLQNVLKLSSHQRLAVAVVGFAWGWCTFYLLIKHLPYIMIHGGLLTPIFATIIIGLSGPHLVTTIFSWRPLVEIGSATYCLYLLHFNTFILIHTHHLPERLHFARFDPWVSYVVVIAFALAARKFIEHPCQRLIGEWWKRRKASRTLQQAA
ncbi:MAG TPA: acyltransferase [Acidobacteriaceae bacterium]